jgi:hypothetical protein
MDVRMCRIPKSCAFDARLAGPPAYRRSNIRVEWKGTAAMGYGASSFTREGREVRAR